MRSLLVIASAVVAACGGQGGVEILVKPTPNTARIALFVGKGDPIARNIAPATDVSPYMDTQAWLRDPNNELSQVEGVTGQDVTFGLLGPSDPLSMIVAVGFKDDGRIESVYVLPEDKRPAHVPDDAVARYTFTLASTSEVDQASPYEVHVWEPTDQAAPGDRSRCALVLDKPSGKKVAVVSEDDQDCDGWRGSDPQECLKSTFMGTRIPNTNNKALNCAIDKPFNNGTGTVAGAILGGSWCKDGTGVLPDCRDSNYCVPRSIFASCNGSYDCLLDVSSRNVQGTTIHCPISTDTAGKLCETPIPYLQGLSTLAISGRTCVAGSVRITSPGQPWDVKTTLTLAAGTTSPITLTLGANDTNCAGTITMSGPYADTLEFSALLAVDLDNGHGVAIPITFGGATMGCSSTPMPCTVNTSYSASDTIPACVASPLVVP